MHEKILEELYKTFELKARQGQGGKTFRYVPSKDIVDRMNQVFKGNWSTELISSDIVEDQVLVLVRVMARDPHDSDGIVYFHDGYASHQLAKYTSGVKQGQVIDAGNSYRSAMSKAVKAAVVKWGVGLYLDGDEPEQSEQDVPVMPSSPTPTGAAPNSPAGPPIGSPAGLPSVGASSPAGPPMGPPAGSPSVGAASAASHPVATPVHTPSVPPSVGPPVFEAEPMKSEPSASTFVTEEAAPDAGVSTGPPMSIESNSDTDENRTEVQKVAIQTIMAVHTLDFPALAVKAINRKEDLPTDIDLIKYHDAVTIIQYGNNISQPIQ